MSTPYPKWLPALRHTLDEFLGTPPPVVNDPEVHSSFKAEEQYVREMEKEANEELKNITDSEQQQLEDLAEDLAERDGT